MASKLRFHLDEHISHAIAQALRQRGVDVTTTAEAGLRTLSDEAQMEYARREQRVFVTSDAGFLSRSAQGQSHYGIVYYPPNQGCSILNNSFVIQNPVEVHAIFEQFQFNV
ncbi:MAG: DUF5615 family PIN-like protein, partial [Anaerolineae bacterium]|nr:DUF5615 family PIN-like protein [Anaerolineae bacterium]